MRFMKSKKSAYWLSLLILIIYSGFSALEAAESSQVDSLSLDTLAISIIKYDSLFYNADSVYTQLDGNKITLLGNAFLQYKTSKIKSDTITVSIDDQLAYSLGKSWLQDRNQLLTGEDIYFNFKNKTGFLTNGASSFDKGYYYGNEIRKIDEKIYDIDNGRFTTCNSTEPHFFIKTYKMRFYLGDKVVAKPVIFEVNHFPIFALPFGTFSIKRGRKSGILVPSPGYNNDDGKYVQNIAYYLAYKDLADLTLSADYYEKTGWQVNLGNRYIKRYKYKGDMDLRYRKNITGPQSARYEWYMHSIHHSDFANNTTFDSNLEFISSTRIFEGSSNIDERLNEKITSSLSFKKPLLNNNLYISAKYVDNLKDEVKDITLPKISFALSSKPLYEYFVKDDVSKSTDNSQWWKDLSISYSLLGTHVGDINDPDPTLSEILYATKIDSSGNYIIQHNSGLKHYGKLSYSHKLKGWLNFTQSLSLNEIWFDKDKNSNGFTRGNDYKSMSTLTFSLYGIKQFPNFYLKAIRHILTPNLSFTYKPDFTDNEKFYSFGGLNLNKAQKQRSVNFSLSNKWSLKFKGKEKDKKIDDILKITSNVSYNFENEGKHFSNLSHSLYIKSSSFKKWIFGFSTTPSGTITQDIYDMSWKREDFGVSNWTFNLSSKFSISGNAAYINYFPEDEIDFSEASFFQTDSLNLEGKRIITTIAELEDLEKDSKNWSASFTHSYRTNKTSYKNNLYTSELRSALNAKITKNWSVSYDNYIDLKDNELVSHSFTITRDLHCWKILFKYSKQGDYWNYQFKLFNIALPDDLKFKTSDHN